MKLRIKAVSPRIGRDLPWPSRATAGSAGMDLSACIEEDIIIAPRQLVKIPTGIAIALPGPEYVALVFARSGLGIKHGISLSNGVGVIDSDYFYSDNEGHIFIKITNDSRSGKVLELESGVGFAQGIFMEFGVTVDDEAQGIRNGGLGSTTEKQAEEGAAE